MFLFNNNNSLTNPIIFPVGLLCLVNRKKRDTDFMCNFLTFGNLTAGWNRQCLIMGILVKMSGFLTFDENEFKERSAKECWCIKDNKLGPYRVLRDLRI